MVLLKAKPCPLSSRQALLTSTLSTSSPTISLSSFTSSESDPFRLNITLRLEASAKIPGPSPSPRQAPSSTPPPYPKAPSAHSNLPATRPRESPSDNSRANLRQPDSPLDMRQRPWLQFITIPSSEPVVVSHDLPLSRVFQYESDLAKEDIKPGEEYGIRLDPGYVGTMWWCWGDLEGYLKGKKFSKWRKGWEGWNFRVEELEKDVI